MKIVAGLSSVPLRLPRPPTSLAGNLAGGVSTSPVLFPDTHRHSFGLRIVARPRNQRRLVPLLVGVMLGGKDGETAPAASEIAAPNTNPGPRSSSLAASGSGGAVETRHHDSGLAAFFYKEWRLA